MSDKKDKDRISDEISKAVRSEMDPSDPDGGLEYDCTSQATFECIGSYSCKYPHRCDGGKFSHSPA